LGDYRKKNAKGGTPAKKASGHWISCHSADLLEPETGERRSFLARVCPRALTPLKKMEWMRSDAGTAA
jgi:hypothetical protein